MSKKYFYRLGHCPLLGLAEYSVLSKDAYFENNQEWILSNNNQQINTTGSLILSGEVIEQIPDSANFDSSKVIQSVESKLKEEVISKLGIAVFPRWQQTFFRLAKTNGYKKINLLKNPEKLNFGHWKSCKKWLLSFKFEGKIIFGLINDYANQEFWAGLDTSLPNNNISKGIINLKLARSLVNLAGEKLLWDPFAGQGRVFISSLDKERVFLNSDKDLQCLPEIKENYEHAKKYWLQKSKYLGLGKSQGKGGKFPDPFFFDVTKSKIEKIEEFSGGNAFSIVTEGYLGKNYGYLPSFEEFDQQLNIVFQIWKKFLKSVSRVNVKEIIFCVPAIKTVNPSLTLQMFEKILKENNFTIINPSQEKKYILYRRPQTIVAHQVIMARKD